MRKKALSVAVATALLGPGAAPAIDFKVSGQVNRMIRFADDGKASDIQFLDNEASRSRIRFRGSQDIGNGMTAGIYIETSVASADSQATPLKSPGEDIAFDIRHSRLSFSGKWGQLMLGHTSDATDLHMQVDSSGNTLSDFVETPLDFAGSIAWRTADGGRLFGPACTGTGGACTVEDSRNSFDGGREDLIRYDTPALGPLGVQVSAGNRSTYDVGADLNADIGPGQFALSGGYKHAIVQNNYVQWGISGSYLFSQGTSITFSFGQRDYKADLSSRADATNYFIKLAHKWGNNVISGSYGRTDDLLTKGADSWGWGLGFNHVLPKPGIELYAGYRMLGLDANANAKSALGITGKSVKDMNLFVVGSRIQFN